MTTVAGLWMLADMHDVRKFKKPVTPSLEFAVRILFWCAASITLITLVWSIVLALINTPTTGC